MKILSIKVFLIVNKFYHLVEYCFNGQNLKNPIFIFFSDINSQINKELIKIVKNENKDYLIDGKEINDFLIKIKGYKYNIESEKIKLVENYNNLKENIINSLLIYYNKEIELLKNKYNNLINEYNSLIFYIYNEFF